MASANDTKSIDRLWDEWVVRAAGVAGWRRRLGACRSRLGLGGPAPRDAAGWAGESRLHGGGTRFILLFAAILACRIPDEDAPAAGWLAELQDLGVALGGRARTIAALLAARRAVAGEQGRTAAAGTLGGLAAAAPLAEWHTASRLALSGMASVLIRDAAVTVAEHPRKPLHGPTLRLWDAVEAGRGAEADALFADGRIEAQPSTGPLARTYRELHRLMAAVVEGGLPVPVEPAIAAACAAVGNGILAGHLRLAWLAAAGDRAACRRECAQSEDSLATTPSSLLALAPVRAALVAGDGDLAERWLVLRRSRGLSCPGDTALWLRLHLLRGETALAARAAGPLVRDAAAYDCRRRIAFELGCGGGPEALALLEAGLTGAGMVSPAAPAPADGPFAGGSAAAATLRERIRRCAASGLPVVLVGEPGSGREAAARAIHAASAQSARPFTVLSCAPPGAGDGGDMPWEGTRDGTVLLRDLALVDGRRQALLAARLRGIAGVRVMAVLGPEDADRLHPALAAVLRRIELRIPALRDRAEDIPGLAADYLTRALGGRTPHLSADLRRTLAARPWRGNLPELRAAMERMAVFFPHAPSYRIEHLDDAGGAPEPGPRTHPGLARPARLAELRRLFRARGRLTRAEVIAHAGIAPATATADLRALVAEGCIHRVAPTPAPYMAYFAWTGQPDADRVP